MLTEAEKIKIKPVKERSAFRRRTNVPKFSVEPLFATHELLAVVRRASDKSDADERERCALERVVCSIGCARGLFSPVGRNLSKVLSFFLKNRLSLL